MWIARTCEGRLGIGVIRGVALAFTALTTLVLVGCDAGPATTPAITPGTPAHPRVVVILASEFAFTPPVVDLVPGETVILQIVNGGVAPHEAVVGGQAVQDAWERAEAEPASAPPGATPAISIEPDLAAAGLRVTVRSGQRVDVTWHVPGAAAAEGAWSIGCHIPGHLAAGMIVPIRFVGPGGVPLATAIATLPGNPAASASVIP